MIRVRGEENNGGLKRVRVFSCLGVVNEEKGWQK